MVLQAGILDGVLEGGFQLFTALRLATGAGQRSRPARW
jgi:hypothetical protein